MTLYAVLTKNQARYLANYIAKTKSGAIASNSNYSATSTRITATAKYFENDKKNVLIGINSNYVADVIDELPEKYKKFSWSKIDGWDLDSYLHDN